MKFKNADLHEKLWLSFMKDRPNLLRRFAGDQNLLSEFIKGPLDVIHFLILGHNHISGMTEREIDTPKEI